MSKVSLEVAQKEIESWLDYKKISAKKREEKEDNIKVLVDAVCEGTITVKEDHTFVHSLLFPLDGEIKITKMEYKPRVDVSQIQLHLQGIKAGDGDSRLVAYVAALTGQAKNIIKKLDSEDYSIAQAVAFFFI